MTLSINDTQHNNALYHYAECHYAECRILFIVMLKRHYAESCYAEFHYTECRGALVEPQYIGRLQALLTTIKLESKFLPESDTGFLCQSINFSRKCIASLTPMADVIKLF